MTPKELLTYFGAKQWSVRRKIFDRKLDIQSAFYGKAVFYLFHGKYLYEESGELHWKTEIYPAKRRSFYDFIDGKVRVSFETGAFFYFIDCSTLPQVEVQHSCINDLYRGQITIQHTTWRTAWEVQGPHKTHSIFTEFF